MNAKLVTKLNESIVNVYKLVGSTLLCVILLGLVSYLVVQGFFVVNRSWLAPTVISPTDERILGLSAQAAQQGAARDRLEAERRDLVARIADAERTIQAERAFQERFRVALATERDARARELGRLRQLDARYGRAALEIGRSNRAFAGMSRVRTEALARARLIDGEARLQANYQLAQMAQSNLSLEGARAELKMRLALARRDVDGYASVSSRLSSLLAPAPATALTRQALELEQEFTQSDLQLARTQQALADLHQSLSAADATLARYDRLLQGLRASPYLKAIEGNLTVAFVPYENLDSVRTGASLYGCSLMLLWCRPVGEVTRVLDGEVSLRHPVRQQTLRGVMVELSLGEGRWAQEQLLHVGRPPLLL